MQAALDEAAIGGRQAMAPSVVAQNLPDYVRLNKTCPTHFAGVQRSRTPCLYTERTLFTIKHAAGAVGVSEATLRTWERRYEVVTPQRSEGGYRVYDAAAIARLSAMRKLIGAGWSPARAAAAIR